MSFELSCAFATSMATPDHVAVAESLGYRRAWLYDSPALYPDVWVMPLRRRTSTIGLGPGEPMGQELTHGGVELLVPLTAWHQQECVVLAGDQAGAERFCHLEEVLPVRGDERRAVGTTWRNRCSAARTGASGSRASVTNRATCCCSSTNRWATASASAAEVVANSS